MHHSGFLSEIFWELLHFLNSFYFILFIHFLFSFLISLLLKMYKTCETASSSNLLHYVCKAYSMLTVVPTVGYHLPKKSCPEYDTKLHLMMRLQFWRTRKCCIALHYHYCQIYNVIPYSISTFLGWFSAESGFFYFVFWICFYNLLYRIK